MTNATLAFAVALLGWAPLVVLLAWRLRRAERDIDGLWQRLAITSAQGERNLESLCVAYADGRQLRQDLTQTARNAAKTADDLTDLRGEYLAQARALDAHDERLITLERDSEEVRTAYFKTAATVEDHGDRLDHVEQYAPEP